MESTAEPWLPPVPDELPRGAEPDTRCGNCGHKDTEHYFIVGVSAAAEGVRTRDIGCMVDDCVCREYEDPEDA